MKHIVITLAAAAMVACSQAPSLTKNLNTVSARFIENCSGVKLNGNDDHDLIAASNCLGRIRGFADGHALTTQLIRMGGIDVPQAWCIDVRKTDREVLESVLAWANTHSSEFDRMINKYDRSDAAYTIAFKALNDTYPCKGDS